MFSRQTAARIIQSRFRDIGAQKPVSPRLSAFCAKARRAFLQC
jgi:hypothetical protein